MYGNKLKPNPERMIDMKRILDILEKDARITPEKIAVMTGMSCNGKNNRRISVLDQSINVYVLKFLRKEENEIVVISCYSMLQRRREYSSVL